MPKHFYIITSVCILVFVEFQCFGQNRTLIIGAGISPVHRTVQNDFKNFSPPIRGFIGYKLGHVVFEFSYNENAGYAKDRFSFTHKGPSFSLAYFVKKRLETSKINPYIRLGLNYKNTLFTTEGYPGITGYEHKIEKDKSLGLELAAGAKYPLHKLIFGIEALYAKNSPSNFLAGGFSPQPINSDHFLIEINLAIPINLSSHRRLSTACPNL